MGLLLGPGCLDPRQRRAGISASLREVQTREFAVVFSGGLVVCAGGFEFGHKTAQVYPAVIGVNISEPVFTAVMAFAIEHSFEF